jgi:hypothetical protein
MPIFRLRLRVPLFILGRAYSRRYSGLATDDPFVSFSLANRRVSKTQDALGIEMRDLLDVTLLERLALEEVDRHDIGLVRPVDREQHVVDAERHDGAEEGRRGKIAAARDHQILRQVLRRRSFEAAPT